jgi:flagellar motor switch/type III secretory pathway protein FliN
MSTATVPSCAPYVFKGLPAFSREEVTVWNWYSRIAPRGAQWKSWLADIFGHLVQKPAGYQFELLQTHLVDAAFGEKVLNFGSKQELFIGHSPENDVVLPGKAIADRHARLILRNDELFLQDLGGTLGTYLWDKRIHANKLQPLRNGDQFSVFPFRFRVVLDRRWTPETQIALSQYQLEMVSRAVFSATSPVGWRSFAVNSPAAGKAALFEVNAAFLLEIQRRLLDPLHVRPRDAVPSDDTLVEFVILALLENLNRRLKLPLQLSLSRAKANAATAFDRGIAVSSSIAVGEIPGQFRIFLPLDFFPWQKDGGESTQECPPGLCWQFPVSVGFVDLSPDEIAHIDPGDVLVTENVVAVLYPNDFSRGWAVVAEASNFRSFRVDKYFQRSAPVETGEATGAVSKADVASLPLRLHVILGEKELTFSEIQSLSAGTIVQLETIKPDSVSLMVNGKVLGDGELVEVEGKLAVRVLGWRSV